MQRNPGDWEAWVGQGPINVHQREYLATTDEGVASLRSRLRRDIRRIAKGASIPRPEGTPDKPVPTYGGDTILRIPKSNVDDHKLMENMQREVAKCYFAADKYRDEERTEFIRREVVKFTDD
jgi:hypothetical protein